MTKLLEYKAGRDKARAEILAGKPTLLFLSVAKYEKQAAQEPSSSAPSNRTLQPLWCLKGKARCAA